MLLSITFHGFDVLPVIFIVDTVRSVNEVLDSFLRSALFTAMGAGGVLVSGNSQLVTISSITNQLGM